MTALSISFCIAIIPPIIGAVFVPETLGMRKVDFNEEKKEEKIQRAISRDEDGEGLGGRLLSMLSTSPRHASEQAHENYTELSNIPSSGSGSQESKHEVI